LITVAGATIGDIGKRLVYLSFHMKQADDKIVALEELLNPVHPNCSFKRYPKQKYYISLIAVNLMYHVCLFNIAADFRFLIVLRLAFLVFLLAAFLVIFLVPFLGAVFALPAISVS